MVCVLYRNQFPNGGICAHISCRCFRKLLLEAGADANAHPPMSDTPEPMTEAPLHVLCSGICTAHTFSPAVASAAAEFAAGAVRELRARGAKVGSATMALLPMAAMRGKADAVTFLVDVAGVDPNYRGRQGMTSLILAARGGKKDVVKLLMGYDALDLDMVDNGGKRAVDYASANGKKEIVEILSSRS